MSIAALKERFPAVSRVPAPEISNLLARIRDTYDPLAVLLYGSKARGESRPDSDWDLKIIVSDDAPEALFSPLLGWSVQDGAGVHADISCARISEFEADLSIANSAAREVLRDGILLETA